MAALRKRGRSGILAVISLAVLVLAGMAIGLSAHPPKTAPQPSSSPAMYSLACSQITVGAACSTGGAYRMKDVLKIASPSERTQNSGSYMILDTQFEEEVSSSISPAGVVIWGDY